MANRFKWEGLNGLIMAVVLTFVCILISLVVLWFFNKIPGMKYIFKPTEIFDRMIKRE